jgi:O-glycosyl hydrolase
MDKEFIKDGLNNVELVNIVSMIIKRKKEIEYKDDNEKFEKLKEEFPEFAERYLMLFEMAIRNEEFDWNSFNYMLNMRNKIINDEMTAEDASKKVGEDWYDKYVKQKKRKY